MSHAVILTCRSVDAVKRLIYDQTMINDGLGELKPEEIAYVVEWRKQRARRQEVRDRVASGERQSAVAASLGFSRQRVWQIVNRYKPPNPDDLAAG